MNICVIVIGECQVDCPNVHYGEIHSEAKDGVPSPTTGNPFSIGNQAMLTCQDG